MHVDNDACNVQAGGGYEPIFALCSKSDICMRQIIIKLSVCLIFVMLGGYTLFAQQQDAFTCFNAQEIHFPLSANDFSKNQILQNEQKVNALYYLYKDKYSFWYKFIADEDITIQFSVAPGNSEDKYRAVAFKYGNSDFCDRLINDNLQPINLSREPMFSKDDIILFRNTIEAAAGDTFYVSVLSLNRDDCGHFLYMEAGGEKLSIHAIHSPCYNFVYLDNPDFNTSKMDAENTELNLSFDNDSVAEPDTASIKTQDTKTGFEALETVEVQSKEEGFVSVGDKLVLNKVYFYNNTYALKPDADIELNQLVDFLKGNPSVELEIQGHTANNTDEIIPDPNFKGQGKEWNFKGSAFELSEARAKAVVKYLIENGISKKRLEAVGYGDTQKRVVDAKTFEEFEKNMRVEALVVKE